MNIIIKHCNLSQNFCKTEFYRAGCQKSLSASYSNEWCAFEFYLFQNALLSVSKIKSYRNVPLKTALPGCVKESERISDKMNEHWTYRRVRQREKRIVPFWPNAENFWQLRLLLMGLKEMKIRKLRGLTSRAMKIITNPRGFINAGFCDIVCYLLDIHSI